MNWGLKRAFIAGAASVWLAATAYAQDMVWVQIEAQPTLAEAQERIRDYTAALDNVVGFSLGTGWYGIALGPYTRADAEAVLRQLRVAGRIPRDSFVALGNNFRQQFWPIGAQSPTAALAVPDTVLGDTDLQGTPAAITPGPSFVPDETVQEARRSESRLTREERRNLQRLLRWAGVYNAGIDGAFGRGTRAAMADWQAQKGYPETGVLTSAQRAELLSDYNAVLAGLDLRVVRSAEAGIEIALPQGAVVFDEIEAPFVKYKPAGEIDAQVLLISQPGTEATMLGLYDILETLEIMPEEGPRARTDQGFEMEGIGDTVHSYAYAERAGGAIKGFILVWPADDEARRTRLVDEMRASFRTLPGVLDPSLGIRNEDQAIDLVAGLQVRQPRLSRSGFYVDGTGTVVTTDTAVASCGRITLDGLHEAQVRVSLPDLGLAVVQPAEAITPAAFARFQTDVPRLKERVAVAGYSYEGVLGAPTLTFGELADIRGLSGEVELDRLALEALPGDAGGPVFGPTGTVIGMLLSKDPDSGRQLPDDVSFSVDAGAMARILSDIGVRPTTSTPGAPLPAEDLTTVAADITVLVSCWD